MIVKQSIEGSFVVSYSFSDKDAGVLIVGEPNGRGTFDIVNAFQNEDAQEILKMLTTIPEKKDGDTK